MTKLFAHIPLLLVYEPDPPRTAIPQAEWPAIHTRHAAGESFRNLGK